MSVLLDERVVGADSVEGVDEGAVGQGKHRALVADGDAAAALEAGVLEGPAGDALAGFGARDLQRDDGARGDLVLDAGVKPLGVLAQDHDVDVVVAGAHPRQAHDGPPPGEQVEALAELHVGRAEALALGGGERALEADAVALDAVDDRVGEGVADSIVGGLTGDDPVPLDRRTGGPEDLDSGAGDLGTDAVALDEGDPVGHASSCRVGPYHSGGSAEGGGESTGAWPRIESPRSRWGRGLGVNQLGPGPGLSHLG